VGFFKDLRKLSKVGQEMQDSMPPPAAQMAAAQIQMAAMTAQMNQQVQAGQAIAADGVAGTATVISAAQTGALVNFNPSVRLELLVTLPGQPPYPVSVECVVPQIHLARVQPGSTVPVDVARTDRQQVLIDWNRPG
jgi:hypothetical protein